MRVIRALCGGLLVLGFAVGIRVGLDAVTEAIAGPALDVATPYSAPAETPPRTK
ncbi:MAG: hypothetical protein AAGA56_29375 [Myxococcota bacterium]